MFTHKTLQKKRKKSLTVIAFLNFHSANTPTMVDFSYQHEVTEHRDGKRQAHHYTVLPPYRYMGVNNLENTENSKTQ